MEILVFQTSLHNRKKVSQARDHIGNLPGIIRWNVDLHDSDKVLRIEAEGLSPRIVEHTLRHAGIECRELE